jgi:hypothetical protein
MSKIGALRDLLFDLLAEHERDGTIPTNARFLYYELVQRGELSKERKGARRPDQDLHDALTDLREEGLEHRRDPLARLLRRLRDHQAGCARTTARGRALTPGAVALRWC